MKYLQQMFQSRWGGLAALVLAAVLTRAPAGATTVTTIAGGPPTAAGYVDGETAVDSRFNGPMGMAFDSIGYLYVADYNNNAVRQMDLVNDSTGTFVTGSHPVGISIDQNDNIYVLYYGKGTNGALVQYDIFGDIIATNATGLKFVGGVASDFAGNVYVTSSNQVVQVISTRANSLLVTVTNSGSLLKGITLMNSGLLAVADYGRNGIYEIDPIQGIVATNTGFNGAGDAFGPSSRAKFLQPFGLLSVGNDVLIVADSGNNRVKVVDHLGTVTNLYGVDSNYWAPISYSPTPGLWDGTVMYGPPGLNYNYSNYVEARIPTGLAMDGNGTLYASEDYYDVIRTVTSANLPLSPQPPLQVPPPAIGYITFSIDQFGETVANFNPLPSSSLTTFNNDQIFIIYNTTKNVSTYFNYGPTPLAGNLPDPTTKSYQAVIDFYDGEPSADLNANANMVPVSGATSINAMSTSPGAPNSDVVSARVSYVTANPSVNGANAAAFQISCPTVGASIYYTTDGSDPTNGSNRVLVQNTSTLSLSMTGTNLIFKAIATKPNYIDSAVVTTVFTSGNYQPNGISFGFASGEASSAFIASPGQSFYAPVTLSLLPGAKMYSLQFNLMVTNVIIAQNIVTNAGNAITNTVVNTSPALIPSPGYLSFESTLMEPDRQNSGVFVEIPPAMYTPYVTNFGVSTNYVVSTNNLVVTTNATVVTNILSTILPQDPPPEGYAFSYFGVPLTWLKFINPNENLLAVGWLESVNQDHLYDAKSQDLITYSEAHDIVFHSSDGKVEVGDYSFQVPPDAAPGQMYQIKIGRPSATSDGVGDAAGNVIIMPITNGSFYAGAPNAIKNVTIGQLKYVVGDVSPFRWFNAGDFGDTNLNNADVMQVFQAVIYGFGYPPPNSDFFDAMDSCGGTYVNNGNGYLEYGSPVTSTNSLDNLFYGDDTSIDQIAFGDGNLDVCDIYVTFRRSLDPSLNWFQRFWTNGVRVAQIVPNVTPNKVARKSGSSGKASAQIGANGLPLVNFSAADIQGTAGQTVNVPITAQVVGGFPLRVLGLGLSVEALDGSPALVNPIQFTPVAALGAPTISATNGNASCSAVWLDSTIAGLTGTAVIGTLSVPIPATATGQSAYDIHFDHASGSPNGLASFQKQVLTGLITLSARTNSTYNDGIPDSWRLRWFGTIYNALSVSNAAASTDGINNWQKYVAGVDPTVPNDFPSLLPKGTLPSGATSAIHWPTVSGKQYVIERSYSLFGGWSPVSTNTGTGTDMEFDDTAAGGARFYRVQILP